MADPLLFSQPDASYPLCATAGLPARDQFTQSPGQVHFHLTSGHDIWFSDWYSSIRFQVQGDEVLPIVNAAELPTYTTFRQYLDQIFGYAGTLSLNRELQPISLLEVQPGDVLIRGGSPGHAVLVLDVAEQPATGQKYMLLAQSYMPAQQAHVLLNHPRTGLGAWYAVNPARPDVRTPERTFAASELRRFRSKLICIFSDMAPSIKRKKLVVLTGAGISAESCLATFRGSDGLWEGHRVEDVATPEAFMRNPKLVLEFYNQRRTAARAAQPNAGHLALVALEQAYEVVIVTQNVDDLHERAGSTHVIHLHGQLFQSRSTRHEELVYPMNSDRIDLGDLCEKGHQLRPNIVWFGEAVPLMERAIEEAATADIFMVIGTSLQVYPAAGLVNYAPTNCPIYIIDPNQPPVSSRRNLHFIAEPATTGVSKVAAELLAAS